METWLYIWLVVALVFAVGEMATPGSFYLLPFAVGALAAAVVAIPEPGLVVEWAAFFGFSVATLAGLRPLARRLDRDGTDNGIGSRRLIGQTAIVTRAIPARGEELGLARVQREDWRAESLDGLPIPEGTKVQVAEVEGTRVLVTAIDAAPGDEPPPTPPQSPSQGADL